MLRTKLPSIRKAPLRGKRVLVRVGMNVPFKKGRIVDDFRIHSAIPTVKWIIKNGGIPVLMTHIEPMRSIDLVKKRFEKLLGRKVEFLPNLRNNPGEKKNAPAFARKLASQADIYINDAFSVSHRKHASIVAITKYLPSYAGLQFIREIDVMEETMKSPHPFLFILGGVKIKTKITVLNRFLKKADDIFIGGALANTFMMAHGFEMGRSIMEPKMVPFIQKNYIGKKKIFLPVDARIGPKTIKDITELQKRDKIYDVGPLTLHLLEDRIKKARMIVWNGPMGIVDGGYQKGTKELIKLLARAKGKVIIGGGDTNALIHKMHEEKNFYHLSTGGGAMLEYLEDGVMPGLSALKGK